jgi:hypothetical protein
VTSNDNPIKSEGITIKGKTPLYVLWALTTAVTLVLDRVTQLASDFAKYEMDVMGFKDIPLTTEYVLRWCGYLWMAAVISALIVGWAVTKKSFEVGLVFAICQAMFFLGLCGLVAWGLLIPFQAVDSGVSR